MAHLLTRAAIAQMRAEDNDPETRRARRRARAGCPAERGSRRNRLDQFVRESMGVRR